MISEGTDILPAPHSSHYNKLLRDTGFPSSWKLENVTLVYKMCDISKPSGYRPMFELPRGKLMERHVHKHIHNLGVSNYFIGPHQSGLSDSAGYQLTFLQRSLPGTGKEKEV